MRRLTPRTPRFALLLLVAILSLWTATGCSFDRKWKRLAAVESSPAAAGTPADHLAGRWEGVWESERSNHKGTLRAIVTPVDDATYRAVYDATYMGVLRFGYSMDVAAEPAGDGVVRFKGQEDLGWLAGGLYRYDGTADGQRFDATYEAKSDHGVFRMTRPSR